MNDLLIIGQGLVGSCLAIQALAQGLKVMVLGDSSQVSATQVAAGVMNPITGKRLVKSWSESAHVQTIHFYQFCETQLKTRFLYQRELIRFLNHATEQEEYRKKQQLDEYANQLGREINTTDYPQFLSKGLGFLLQSVYQLDTQAFLKGAREYLIQEGAYQDLRCDYGDIQWGDGVSYQDLKAQYLVCCEGHQASENPFFDLQFLKSKGAFLTVEISGLPDRIYNHGPSLSPSFSPGLYRYGSNHIWEFPDEQLRDEDWRPLVIQLAGFLKYDYQITDAQVGIRPTLKSREAVYGYHDVYPMGIINGLGSQGCILAPILVQKFLDLKGKRGLQFLSLKTKTEASP